MAENSNSNPFPSTSRESNLELANDSATRPAQPDGLNRTRPYPPEFYHREYFNYASYSTNFSRIGHNEGSIEWREQTSSFSYRVRERSGWQQRRLPARRKWEVTEFGHEWYESMKQQSRDKMRKTTRTSSHHQHNHHNQHHESYFKFKLATYNLLAPNLLDDNFFLYDRIRDEFLNWEFRKRKILEQIEHEHSDEMDENQYFQFFLPKLTEFGYSSFFKKRLGQKRDGCVICFSMRKFELVKLDQVEFNVPGIEILNRENVGLIALLRARNRNGTQSSKHVCVATTHLLYNPKRGDCKLAQIQVFLAHLDRMAHRGCSRETGKILYHPVILCGDLNLTTESALYEFLSTAKLVNYKQMNSYFLSGQLESSSSREPQIRLIETAVLPESLGITDQSQFKQDVDSRNSHQSSENDVSSSSPKAQPNYTFGAADLSHAFRFCSVYDHQDKHGSPEVTTCTRNTKRTVDYIFFHSDENNEDNDKTGERSNNSDSATTTSMSSRQTPQRKRLSSESSRANSNGLKLIARLQLFTKNLVPDYSIPDQNYPSDHFLLAAKFLLT